MKKYERKRKLPIKFNVGKENTQYIRTLYTQTYNISNTYIFFYISNRNSDFCLKIIKKSFVCYNIYCGSFKWLPFVEFYKFYMDFPLVQLCFPYTFVGHSYFYSSNSTITIQVFTSICCVLT